MKCPKCGYTSFDHLESCKKCGVELVPKIMPTAALFPVSTSDELDGMADIEASSDELYPAELILEDVVEGDLSNTSNVEYSVPTNSDYSGSGVELYDLVNKTGGVDVYLTLASIKQRVVAFAIDLLIVIIVGFLTLLFGLYNLDARYLGEVLQLSYIFLPIYLMLFLLSTTYFVFLHGYGSKTIGKLVLGLKVVKEGGSRVEFNDSLIRWIGYFLSFIFLLYGFISALSNKKMQAWHDKLAKTIVVED